MIVALTMLTAGAVLALVALALLADADAMTLFHAQTSSSLLLVIVGVVCVASLVTAGYMRLFGGVADRIAERKFSRYVGWKFLRSQRLTETLRSRLVRTIHQARSRSKVSLIKLVGWGLLGLGLGMSLSLPQVFNVLADAVSPVFASTLHWSLYGLGGLTLALALLSLLTHTRAEAPAPFLKRRAAVTLPTFISIVGVAIGLWALIVVLGAMNGLQSDMREKILRTNSHLLIESQATEGTLPRPLDLEHTLRQRPDIVEAQAFVRGEVMMSSPTATAVNVLIKGMEPSELARSEQIAGRIIDGSLLGLEDPGALLPLTSAFVRIQGRKLAPSFMRGDALPVDEGLKDDIAFDAPNYDLLPGILLGVELARNLRVEVGDEIQLISPDGDIGPTGLRPKLQKMRVAGLFETGMYEYDQKLAYTNLYTAQRFFELGSERNALEARFTQADIALTELTELRASLAGFEGIKISSFRDRNKSLFSALALERIVMFIILGFIVFVASLLIVSSLVMLVVEKVREIAVLKALGATDRSIISSFVHIGAFIGLFGILSGVPLGVGTLLALISQGLTLPSQFYIRELPVRLDAVEIMVFSLAALAMCLLATVYPSRKASQLKPAEGLRHG